MAFSSFFRSEIYSVADRRDDGQEVNLIPFNRIFIKVISVKPDISPGIDVDQLELPLCISQLKEGPFPAYRAIEPVVGRHTRGVDVAYNKEVLRFRRPGQSRDLCSSQWFGIGLSGSVAEDGCHAPPVCELVSSGNVDIVRAIIFRGVVSGLEGVIQKLNIKSRKLSAGNTEGITNETGHGPGLLFQKKLGSVSESFSEPEEFAVLQAGWIRNKWVRLKEISHGTVIDLNIQPVPGKRYGFGTE